MHFEHASASFAHAPTLQALMARRVAIEFRPILLGRSGIRIMHLARPLFFKVQGATVAFAPLPIVSCGKLRQGYEVNPGNPYVHDAATALSLFLELSSYDDTYCIRHLDDMIEAAAQKEADASSRFMRLPSPALQGLESASRRYMKTKIVGWGDTVADVECRSFENRGEYEQTREFRYQYDFSSRGDLRVVRAAYRPRLAQPLSATTNESQFVCAESFRLLGPQDVVSGARVVEAVVRIDGIRMTPAGHMWLSSNLCRMVLAPPEHGTFAYDLAHLEPTESTKPTESLSAHAPDCTDPTDPADSADPSSALPGAAETATNVADARVAHVIERVTSMHL
jgi:hypothetical protein